MADRCVLVSALEELLNDEIGDNFIELVQRTIRAVAVARNFPPPDGHHRWNADAVVDITGQFFADPSTSRRLVDLATHCRTDDALRNRLQKTVRSFLADLGRRTPTGRLVLRINEVLGRSTEFERHDRSWALTGTSGPANDVDVDRLIAVAVTVDVVVPTAWGTGTRQSPDIDAASLVEVASAVLAAAGGALKVNVLAKVVAARLGIGAAPLSLDTTAFDDGGSQPSSQPARHSDSTDAAALRTMRAEEVLAMLNDVETIALGTPHLPVAELGPVIGTSGSTAALIRKRAVATVRRELDDDEDGQNIAEHVLESARTWTENWMNTTAPTYLHRDG